MPGNYTHTTRATGTVLTATIYNTDHQNHIDNQTPAGTDDQSVSVAAMQATVDPGEVGTESLPTSLQGELERIRFVLKDISGKTQWYETPPATLITLNNKPISFNYTFNGDFEIWGSGTAAAPTGWTLSGAGATIVKDVTNFKIGTAGVAITRVGTDARLSLAVASIAGFGPATWWRGKTVTFGCWVRATVAARARVNINDGIGESNSATHSGGGTFEFLTATKTIDAAATQVNVIVDVITGDTTAQFDGAILVVGSSVSDFIPSGWRGRKSVLFFQTQSDQTVPAGSTVFLGTGGHHATEDNVASPLPYKGVARNLWTRVAAQPGVGQTYVYTVRKQIATDTALTSTNPNGSQVSSDTNDEVQFLQNDLIDVKLVTSATAVVTNHKVGVEYEEIP